MFDWPSRAAPKPNVKEPFLRCCNAATSASGCVSAHAMLPASSTTQTAVCLK